MDRNIEDYRIKVGDILAETESAGVLIVDEVCKRFRSIHVLRAFLAPDGVVEGYGAMWYFAVLPTRWSALHLEDAGLRLVTGSAEATVARIWLLIIHGSRLPMPAIYKSTEGKL